ncbi:hypothetical protein RCCS2_14184 [Roseobacter sp. CCS2]|nr:hypothetical protein RCCS2_14184 [Roseobacter sp. CCS2]
MTMMQACLFGEMHENEAIAFIFEQRKTA